MDLPLGSASHHPDAQRAPRTSSASASEPASGTSGCEVLQASMATQPSAVASQASTPHAAALAVGPSGLGLASGAGPGPTAGPGLLCWCSCAKARSTIISQLQAQEGVRAHSLLGRDRMQPSQLPWPASSAPQGLQGRGRHCPGPDLMHCCTNGQPPLGAGVSAREHLRPGGALGRRRRQCAGPAAWCCYRPC